MSDAVPRLTLSAGLAPVEAATNQSPVWKWPNENQNYYVTLTMHSPSKAKR